MDRFAAWPSLWSRLAVVCRALFAADETEPKDEAGKTSVHYIVEASANVASAGTTDPARQVGVIFCFQEHISPPGADIFLVRESLKRLGLSAFPGCLVEAPEQRAGETCP